jgi:ABC-type transporter Mla subunit MlaD
MTEARGLGHVKPKAGSFVLGAALIAMTGLFLAGRAQGWFAEKLRITTEPMIVPRDSSLGLESGAEVQILGTTVGSIEEVKLDDDGSAAASEVKLHFTMRVRGPLIKLVGKDSEVQLRRKFGVAGSPFVLITAGHDKPYDGTALKCTVPPDLTAEVEATLRRFNEPGSPVQKILADAATLTSNLVAGKGAVGRLLSNADTGEQLAGAMTGARESIDNVNKLLAKAQSTDVSGLLEQLHGILGRVDEALKEVTAATAQLRQQTRDLPALLAQTQEMMRQTTRTIEGMQKTWLLRDHVAAEGSTRLSPSDVTAP